MAMAVITPPTMVTAPAVACTAPTTVGGADIVTVGVDEYPLPPD